MASNQKANVALTIQVGDNTRDIQVNDIVDFDQVIGTVSRHDPATDTTVDVVVRLGDVVDPTHFTPVKASKAAPDSAPAAPPAAAKKPTE